MGEVLEQHENARFEHRSVRVHVFKKVTDGYIPEYQ